MICIDTPGVKSLPLKIKDKTVVHLKITSEYFSIIEAGQLRFHIPIDAGCEYTLGLHEIE